MLTPYICMPPTELPITTSVQLLDAERSSWSRAFEPIDVPDVSDEEAATFLRQRGVAKKDLTPVVQVRRRPATARQPLWRWDMRLVLQCWASKHSAACAAFISYICQQVTGGRLELLEKCAIMLSKNIALPGAPHCGTCCVIMTCHPCGRTVPASDSCQLTAVFESCRGAV